MELDTQQFFDELAVCLGDLLVLGHPTIFRPSFLMELVHIVGVLVENLAAFLAVFGQPEPFFGSTVSFVLRHNAFPSWCRGTTEA